MNINPLVLNNGIPATTAPTGGGGTAFVNYASSQVTTTSGSVGGSFTTFDNSPAFTFTPKITGTYKVYCSIPMVGNSAGDPFGVVRIINTSGGATLLQESQGIFNPYLVPSGRSGSAYCQSTYTLVAGTSYVFDIQGKNIGNGTIQDDGTNAPFYMFAEGISLNGILNTTGSSFDIFSSSQVTTDSTSFVTSLYPLFTTFDNSPAFTFTPTISGKYKVYVSVPIYSPTPNTNAEIRIWNTSGGATLLQESQAYSGIANIVSNNAQQTLYAQSVYELVAGTQYVFDIQGSVSSGGSVKIVGTAASFYMFAEGIGLNNNSAQFPVNMKVTGSGSWSASNPINLSTILWDTNSGYNPSTGQYTVPYAGFYEIGWNGNGTGGTKQVQIYVNGVATSELIDNGGSNLNAEGLVTSLKLNAKDVVTWVANSSFSTNITTQWISSTSLAQGLVGPQGSSTGSAFAYFASTQVTTISSVISNTSFETFDNSPAFTFTPTISGIYKVYSPAPIQSNLTAAQMAGRVWNTSGGATLLQESQSQTYSASSTVTSSGTMQSVYSLNAGTTYIFDIQGRSVGAGGSGYLRGDVTPFYMFAEGIGLSGAFSEAVTPWKTNLSVTPNSAFGTVTNLVTQSRVVGDTMEFKVSLTAGTNSGATMSLALPTGYVIDASKLNSGGSFLNGNANSLSSTSLLIATTEYQTYPFFDGSDTGNIYFAATTNSNALVKQLGTNFVQSNSPWIAEFSVPIVGLFGSGIDGVSTIAKSASTGATWSIPYNASFNPVLDPGTSPLKAIITTNGGDVEVGLQDDGSGNPGAVYGDDRNNASSTITIRFKRNGIVIASQVMYNQNNISIHEMQIPSSSFKYIDSPPAGTWTYTVEAMTSGSTSANSSINYSIIYAKPLSALGGQAGGMSSENVNAQVYLSSPVSITAGSPIVFNAVDFDTNNAYNISTGQYTIPLTGTYEVAITAFTSGAAPAFSLYKNGSPTIVGGGYITDDIISPQVIANGTRLVTCIAGDILTIVPDTTATLGVNYSAWSIKKIATGGSGPSAWIPYTPTFTGMGTVTSPTFWYKTDGADSIFIKGTWTTGTPTATQAQISLPPGYTSKGTKINSTIESCGTMNHNNSNSVAFAVTIQPNVSYVTFGFNSNIGGDLNPDLGNVVFASSTIYSFSSTAIPIS